MPPAIDVAVQGDRARVVVPNVVQQQSLPSPSPTPPPGVVMATVSEAFAKDAIISWFRGEFAAANAIIDALCTHLAQLERGGVSDYASVFAALHRRRVNWIPILHRQKYFSVADVMTELKKVAANKSPADEEPKGDCAEACSEKVQNLESQVAESMDRERGEVARENPGSSPGNAITDSGGCHSFPKQSDMCSVHEDSGERLARIKTTKGFIAKEPVKGHMVNVVRGLKLHEHIFTNVELSELNDFVKQLRVSGQNGELSEDSFILYNQQVKGNKRELIQLGVPIFGQIKKEASQENCCIEPIPAILEGVIDHLIQWHLIPEHRKPNSCIINFYDEGEYSQPFLKPPHLEQPLSTLLLSESTMAFGRSLVSDGEGNYKGPLMLSLKEGSLLVMRGHSWDTARHVMCASSNKRVSITFFRVRTDAETECDAPEIATSPNKAMAVMWQQPGVPPPYTLATSPVVMLSPMCLIGPSPRRMIPAGAGGTGVFLPWAVRPRKPAKHLPPRAQRGRFHSLPSPGKHEAAPDPAQIANSDQVPLPFSNP